MSKLHGQQNMTCLIKNTCLITRHLNCLILQTNVVMSILLYIKFTFYLVRSQRDSNSRDTSRHPHSLANWRLKPLSHSSKIIRKQKRSNSVESNHVRWFSVNWITIILSKSLLTAFLILRVQRFELWTSSLATRHSNQLSYTRIKGSFWWHLQLPVPSRKEHKKNR